MMCTQTDAYRTRYTHPHPHTHTHTHTHTKERNTDSALTLVRKASVSSLLPVGLYKARYL